MAVVALDTHAVVKELQAAGFTEPQAEALTRAVRKAQEIDLSTLATQTDLLVVRNALDGIMRKRKIETSADTLQHSTRLEIAERKAILMQRLLIGALGLQAIIFLSAPFVLIRLLPH